MDVMHDRVAGLDVHKGRRGRLRADDVAKAMRECRTFETTTDGLWPCWRG